jgi:hypothetical protein
LLSPGKDVQAAQRNVKLASLRIAVGMGISSLSVWGDSQLTVGQAEGTELSPLMKAYAGEVRKLECRFQSLKLEHVPRGQDTTIKELSRIAAKGLTVPFGVAMEKLSQPSQRKRILKSCQHQSKGDVVRNPVRPGKRAVDSTRSGWPD